MKPFADLFSCSSLIRNVLEFSPAAIVVANHSGTILFANHNVKEWFGYATSEITGLGLASLIPGINDRDAFAHSGHFSSRASVPSRESEPSSASAPTGCGGTRAVICKDGSEVLLNVTLLCVKEESEALILATFAKTQDEFLDGTVLESERLDAIAKMIGGLAHESRNALQRAVACLDLLELDLNSNHRQMQLSAKIRRSLSDLLESYDEVRRFAEPLTLKLSPTRLLPICLEVFDELNESLENSENEIEVAPASELADFAFVDVDKMREVFHQVIENALDKRPGTMKLGLSCQSCQLSHAEALRIKIRDDGEAFSEEALIRAFEPFYTSKQHGTGLGLSISRRIVQAHDGIIWACNPSQGGAEIEIVLPRNRNHANA